MSAAVPKIYRFQSAEQWATCLLDRLAPAAAGGLATEIPLGLHAVATEVTAPVNGVAIDPYRQLWWRTDAEGGLAWWNALGAVVGPMAVDGAVAASSRLLADGRWLWAFSPAQVRRYDAETLDSDRTFNLLDLGDPDDPRPDDPVAFLDIAPDGCEGVWALTRTRAGGEALARFDSRGCFAGRLGLPCSVGAVSQIAAVDRGRGLLLLATKGHLLWRLRTADGVCEWTLGLANTLDCWVATRLASDTRDRVGLGGPRACGGETSWCFLAMDAAGDLAQDPLTDLFAGRAPAPAVRDFALGRDLVYFATDQGLFRLDTSEACGAAGAGAGLLTPRLYSPISSNGRGWLRAEIDLTLPTGAALEVSFASTDDAVLADRVDAAANNPGLPAAARQRLAWSALGDANAGPTFTIVGDDAGASRAEIPLFTTDDRWLWLRLELQVPAGVAAPSLGGMRVLYPELSIVQDLPAIFRGSTNDPTGALRRLVGVLETTTQDIDGRIRSIAGQLDPAVAEAGWLDHLAQWLGLPWHRALPEAAKRRLLEAAGDLLDLRGRRAGLLRLLQALVAPGQARVADLTVDYPPVRLGGEDGTGARLPGLLAGVRRGVTTLGGKAVLGRARLGCAATPPDPLADLGPALRIEITTTAEARAALQPLLGDILADYVPAGMRIAIRWRVRPAALLGDADEWVLDGEGPGRLGDDSLLGRTVLAGRPGGIGDAGAAMGLQLR